MKGKKVQDVNVTVEEDSSNHEGKHDIGTKEDAYEFLDNIDFLEHIDMSDYEQEVHSIENDPAEKEDIKVNVDYLDDLAFFDELDYFEQLNKSLEEELKELDGRFTKTAALGPKRRWIKRHSDGLMLGAGIMVLVLLTGGVIGAVGLHLSKTGETYASTMKNQPVESTVKPEDKNQNIVSLVQQEQISPAVQHRSESLVQKRKEPKAVNTEEPVGEEASAGKVEEKDLEKFFSDSVFIGNSLTEGLSVAGGVASAKYFSVKSLNVTDALSKKVIGTGSDKQTILDALKATSCKKIFVMFGVNELAWPYPHVFGERYKQLLEAIKMAKPEADIYVQSILPCAKWVGEEQKEYKKKNIEAFNKIIKQAADDAGCVYLDVGKSVANKDGYLPSDAAVDGIHLKKSYNVKWISYIYHVLQQ